MGHTYCCGVHLITIYGIKRILLYTGGALIISYNLYLIRIMKSIPTPSHT